MYTNDAVSRCSFDVSWRGYFSYEADGRNVKTNYDIHTVRSPRYIYHDTRTPRTTDLTFLNRCLTTKIGYLKTTMLAVLAFKL